MDFPGKSEEEVQRYFMQHLEQKQQEDEGEAALNHVDEEDEAAQVPLKCHFLGKFSLSFTCY